ncbi:carboxypeptidase [Fusarium heterosporum]|uniref:Carboxypeptidase n=1 Tax=Fusarium heterosporum TaxID=42747 RepID=A0A8H5U0S7_FUSHE|nr:carboxypeptidase [Fusarium heterosporum]
MAASRLFHSLVYIRFLLVSALISLSSSQFIPGSDARTRNLTVVRSPANRNVTVSYKTPENVCTTAFDSQKQYTGWVSVPGDYPTNLFFWFVEAREQTDSLTIWLNGGPGSSSLYGFFTGNGPCEVVEKGLNEYETLVREWGWDRASNMLFIDQPNQVGFSYDIPTNSKLDFYNNQVVPLNATPWAPDWLVQNGTFSSNNGNFTANTTETAAMAVWHMIQGFLTTFPQYQPSSPGNGSLGINLFAESYGGRYGPVFAETFMEQNARRESGELPRNVTIDVHLRSLGIINGCVDMVTQVPYYPIFANKNTYGYEALSSSDAKFYLDKFSATGGCRELLEKCAADASFGDPEGKGDKGDINYTCYQALNSCAEIQDAYTAADRGLYDIAAPLADPFPPLTFLEYLNQESVLHDIGSPINYTLTSSLVTAEFQELGDQARGGNIQRLAALLNQGVRIALVYGDRDYICNWLGGEAVSHSLATEAGGEYTSQFPEAGYAPIIVNGSYIGGVVRQFGNLSFSRVYQAGHAVASYQPETAFQIFARVILGTSVSTGKDIDATTYNTTGDANATHTDDLPKQLKPTCYIRNFGSSCDNDAKELLNDDKGIVINGILYSSKEDWPSLVEKTEEPTTSTTDPSTTSDMTGIYTATETPDAAAFNPPNAGLVVAIAGMMALSAVV